MTKRSAARLATMTLAALGTTTAVRGGTGFEEIGDAGGLPEVAQRPAGAGTLVRIAGRLAGADKSGASADLEDMYLIRVVDGDAFSARTFPVGGAAGDAAGGSASFDTQLWLFDAEGFGVVGNDDTPVAGFKTNGSLLMPDPDDGTPVRVEPGLYYLAITGVDNDPLSDGGPIFLQRGPQEISGPDGRGGDRPVAGWTYKTLPAVGDYVIGLTGVAFASSECAADVNGDGIVDVRDLSEVMLAWGEAGGQADITADGAVDVQDLVEVMLAFGPCNQTPAESCPGIGDCHQPHDGPGCDDENCCKIACVSDPFCCEVTWDDICVETADALCKDIHCGTGDCYAAHATPGCETPACCTLVCTSDPYCCDVAWDATCAEIAARQCLAPYCPGGGDCFDDNGTPGCDSEACCKVVCATDPACCEVGWDVICADAANEMCLVENACPGDGDCFLAHEGGGCADADCCSSVCETDPFCCNVEWDQVCATLAVELCDASCSLDCPAGAFFESEACGEDRNGGCNGTPASFGEIFCGDTLCGSSWSQNGVRDTDWYLVTVADGCTRVTADLVSEFPGVVFIVGGVDGCGAVILGEGGSASVCAAAAPASAEVGPGTYVVFVASAGYDGFPCGTMNAYRLSVTCEPVDAGSCDDER